MSMPVTHSQQPRSQIFLSHFLTLYTCAFNSSWQKRNTKCEAEGITTKDLEERGDHIRNPGDIPEKRLFSS